MILRMKKPGLAGFLLPCSLLKFLTRAACAPTQATEKTVGGIDIGLIVVDPKQSLGEYGGAAEGNYAVDHTVAIRTIAGQTVVGRSYAVGLFRFHGSSLLRGATAVTRAGTGSGYAAGATGAARTCESTT